MLIIRNFIQHGFNVVFDALDDAVFAHSFIPPSLDGGDGMYSKMSKLGGFPKKVWGMVKLMKKMSQHNIWIYSKMFFFHQNPVFRRDGLSKKLRGMV